MIWERYFLLQVLPVSLPPYVKPFVKCSSLSEHVSHQADPLHTELEEISHMREAPCVRAQVSMGRAYPQTLLMQSLREAKHCLTSTHSGSTLNKCHF